MSAEGTLSGGVDVKLQRRAIAAAALVVVLFSLVGPPEEADRRDGPASTLRSGPGGAMALFETLNELGFRCGRWYRDFGALKDDPANAGALVLLESSEALTRRDGRRLERWVSRGGTLLYAPTEHDETVLAAFGVEFTDSSDSGLAGEVLNVTPAEPENPSVHRILAEVPTDGYDVPERSLYSDDPSFAELLVAPNGGVACALLRRGRGHVILLADVEGLTNTEIQDSPTVVVIARALAELVPGEAIRFDEFHHGHVGDGGAAGTTWRWLRGTNGGWAVLTALAIGLASLVSAGLRLAPALPVVPKPRRSSLEHVGALSVAYRGSRAHEFPRDRLVDGLRLALGTVDLERKLRQIEASHPDAAASVACVQGALNAKAGERGVELVPLANAIDGILRAVRATHTPDRKS